MKELAEQAMRDGACGMATGLIYTPGSFSKTDELVAIAEIVSKHRGIYASHIRNEGSQLLESLDEILKIVRRSDGKADATRRDHRSALSERRERIPKCEIHRPRVPQHVGAFDA